MKRRTFLTAAATAGVVGTAGCTGSSGGPGGDDGGGEPYDHPALAGLDSQPSEGPPPREAKGLIVAFEDPSCTRCRAFERQVVPEIRTKLVEPGKATFVFRGYPVVYDWGEPAARALEAAYARDPTASQRLRDHYFAEQPAFRGGSAEAVYAMSADFLTAETDLDGTAVTEAAAAGEHDDAVQVDLDAGMDAGAGRTTPHLFLFRDGEYRTKVAGSASYNVIASALNL